MRLNTEQEKYAVELARRRGEVCPSRYCGSADFLTIAGPLEPYQDGSANVLMTCNVDPHPYPLPGEWRIKLSPEELRSIGVGS